MRRIILALSSLLLSDDASSFSSPRSKSRRRRIEQRGKDRTFHYNRLPLDGSVNATHWPLESRRTARTAVVHDETLEQEATASTESYYEDTLLSNVLGPDSDATLFEQELLERYIAHQSLLNSVSDEVDLEQEFELISIPSETDTVPDATTAPESIAIPPKQPPPTATPFKLSFLSDVWKARLLLLLSAALYGTNFTFVKSLDEVMSVGLSSTLRFGFAAAVMLPWLFAPLDGELKALSAREEKNERGSKGDDILRKFADEPTRLGAALAGMEIGMYNSIGYIAQAVGLKTTTASKSAFICSMAVVTVPILDKLWGKPLLRRQVAGACLAAVGVYALELGGTETTLTDGDLLSLVQPLMFGLGFWRMEAAMERYPTEAARLAAAQLLMVFLVSFSYLVCWSPPGDVPMLSDACNVLPSASEVLAWLQDPYLLGMLFWTGVVTTAFTIYMETAALRTLSAAETTLIFSTEPLFGAAFAAAVAGECLGAEAAVGAAFIIGGCVVSGMDVGRLLGGGEDRGCGGEWY